MAQFNGKWEIECSENFGEYMKAIGVSDDKQVEAEKFLGDSSKLTYDITNSGNDWVFKITTPGGERVSKFSLGSEFDTNTLDGRPVKVQCIYPQGKLALDIIDHKGCLKLQWIGDTLIEKQTGSGFETTNKRTVSGNTIIKFE
ncbi:fatty acid-binding protein, liver-like [Saccostrea cucullata]|uniref:fatty acid-binding protein, liver-like n=1 Tax=Saccostrea cuccullata TaxID=36930 RepID=UPI002ED05295